MRFTWAVHLLPLALYLLLLSPQHTQAENVYLYRLKKLRNTFHTQIEDQVASNDALVEKGYADTIAELVEEIAKTQTEAIQGLGEILDFNRELSVCGKDTNPRRLYTSVDEYLQQCVLDAEVGAEAVSEHVIKDIDKFQTRSSEFSQWFMSAYLSDWERIFGEDHYNSVYDSLSAQVVQWDNVGSIELFSFRQDVLKRLANLSAALKQCTREMNELIIAEYDSVYVNAMKCR